MYVDPERFPSVGAGMEGSHQLGQGWKVPISWGRDGVSIKVALRSHLRLGVTVPIQALVMCAACVIRPSSYAQHVSRTQHAAQDDASSAQN